jgi:hypothetical protein
VLIDHFSSLPPSFAAHAHERREHIFDQFPCPRLYLDHGEYAGGTLDILPPTFITSFSRRMWAAYQNQGLIRILSIQLS